MITAYLFWGKIQKSTLNWTSLFTGRVFRLAPMYLLTIAIMVFLCMCFSDFKIVVSLRTLAEQIILWMLFTMLGHPDINNIEHTHLIVAGVTWTLVYEWLFYLSLPIMALLFTKHRNPLTIALSVICSTVIIVLDRTYIHSRFSRMIPFLGGIAAAYWVADARRRELARKPVATIIAISALIFTFTFYHTSFSPFPILLLSITFVAVASGNDCFGLLKLKPVVWLGEISYSIYLLHGIIVTLLLRKCYFANSPSSYLFGTIVACVILVVSSSFTYIYVEKPGIELGRLIMSWIRPLEKRA
jgi:peptidoglycan/LPS O-acetylase OafA/YrhL